MPAAAAVVRLTGLTRLASDNAAVGIACGSGPTGDRSQALLREHEPGAVTQQRRRRQLAEERLADAEAQAGIATGHRMADPVRLARVEEEDLVRLGNGLIVTDVADEDAAIREHEPQIAGELILGRLDG